MENNKVILVDLNKKPESYSLQKNKEKVIKKRVITETTNWHSYLDNHLDVDNQWNMLIELLRDYNINISTYDLSFNNIDIAPEKITFLRKEIQRKIHGYKAQDIKKNIFDPLHFVNIQYILEKIVETELNCYYCQGPVKIWYEICRDPLQWTLERINNKLGHNIGNVEIACLHCNLKRRCMHHEKYLRTKEMKFILKKET
jgi:hypothetical protein